MDRFVSDSKGKDQATFNAAATASILDYVGRRWETLQQYYELVSMSGNNTRETLYTFLRGTVAPAAMSEVLGSIDIFLESVGLVSTVYVPIATYFVSGSGALIFDNYIYDTHSPFTYYTAVKYSLFN